MNQSPTAPQTKSSPTIIQPRQKHTESIIAVGDKSTGLCASREMPLMLLFLLLHDHGSVFFSSPEWSSRNSSTIPFKSTSIWYRFIKSQDRSFNVCLFLCHHLKLRPTRCQMRIGCFSIWQANLSLFHWWCCFFIYGWLFSSLRLSS